MNHPISLDPPRILVVVGHALYEPWKSILYEGQLKTWSKNPSLDVRHCYATPPSYISRKIDSYIWNLKWSNKWGKFVTAIEIGLKFPFKVRIGKIENTFLPMTDTKALFLDHKDFNMSMNYKSFGLTTGTLMFDYEFLVCVTTSSYLNLTNLVSEISKLPRKGVVAGRILNQSNLEFASGTFKVFSRDVVEFFARQKKHYSKWKPEDLSYGLLIKDKEYKCAFYNLMSIDIASEEELSNLDSNYIKQVTHFRLKSGTPEKRNDVVIMRKLHEKLADVC